MKSGMAMSADSILHELFPRARRYTPPLDAAPRRRLRETRSDYPAADFSERHLQCVWYDARWRPQRLTTRTGEPVEVDDPGVWNVEAGPDFLGAVLRLGSDRRRIEGDVEIHLRPADWKQHRHAGDSRYKRVKVHVTYYPGALEPGQLPPGTVELSLKEPLRADPR